MVSDFQYSFFQNLFTYFLDTLILSIFFLTIKQIIFRMTQTISATTATLVTSYSKVNQLCLRYFDRVNVNLYITQINHFRGDLTNVLASANIATGKVSQTFV